jgi:ubiquinone/menaquinone biosynthesis C-methylase UbiE
MSINDRLHALVHRRLDSGFDRKRSASYDRLARWTLRGLYRHVAEDVAAIAPPSATVLDVGTGPGRLLHELAERRPDLALTGMDPSPDMIRLAEQTLLAEHALLAEYAQTTREPAHRIRFQVADVAALPCPDASVDLIVSTLSLHHWPDTKAATAELARVLRPGGRVMIYDFRFAPLAEAIEALATHPGFASHGVRRTPARGGWYPVSPFTRLTTSRSR